MRPGWVRCAGSSVTGATSGPRHLQTEADGGRKRTNPARRSGQGLRTTVLVRLAEPFLNTEVQRIIDLAWAGSRRVASGQDGAGRQKERRKSSMQRQRRLTGAEVDELAEQYRQGRNMAELAERWGISRRTASTLLRRVGVELRGRSKLTTNQIEEIKQLWAQGWLVGDLAEKFGVNAKTVSVAVAGNRPT